MTLKEKGLREDAAIGIFSILFPIVVIVVFAAFDHARVLSVYDLPFVSICDCRSVTIESSQP